MQFRAVVPRLKIRQWSADKTQKSIRVAILKSESMFKLARCREFNVEQISFFSTPVFLEMHIQYPENGEEIPKNLV